MRFLCPSRAFFISLNPRRFIRGLPSSQTPSNLTIKATTRVGFVKGTFDGGGCMMARKTAELQKTKRKPSVSSSLYLDPSTPCSYRHNIYLKASLNTMDPTDTDFNDWLDPSPSPSDIPPQWDDPLTQWDDPPPTPPRPTSMYSSLTDCIALKDLYMVTVARSAEQ
ncbi:hypothetical protein BC829DRAFT_175901 [Chytridium lagenaria]|nr:hypothetical protein BC829DRAFT_175901 [Chytridium lagenaria]